MSLLLGAVAAWFGGRMGAVDPTITAAVRARPPVPPVETEQQIERNLKSHIAG